MTLKNGGHSPAKIYDASHGSSIVDSKKPFLAFNPSGMKPSRGAVGPEGGTLHLDVGIKPMNEATIAAIKAGDIRLYVSGRVAYSDIAAESRTCTFCGYWDPETRGFTLCDTYNDCD